MQSSPCRLQTGGRSARPPLLPVQEITSAKPGEKAHKLAFSLDLPFSAKVMARTLETCMDVTRFFCAAVNGHLGDLKALEATSCRCCLALSTIHAVPP